MLQVLQCLSGQGLTSSGGSGQVGSDGGNSSGASRAAVKERSVWYYNYLRIAFLYKLWSIVMFLVSSCGAIRFRSFNVLFEEIYQKQCGWSVPDTELRESLRLAVAEILLPAYRSFIKRFGYAALTPCYLSKVNLWAQESAIFSEWYLQYSFYFMFVVLKHIIFWSSVGLSSRIAKHLENTWSTLPSNSSCC